MAIVQPSLFSWDAVDARSDLDRLILVRDHIPDEPIIHALEQLRGQGRNDYPVAPMWNAVLAGIVFQHNTIESLIRELRRNPALLEVCGFDVLPIQKKPVADLVRDEAGIMRIVWSAPEEPYRLVPDSHNFSRFLANVIELEETQGLVSGMMVELRHQLMEVLPDFGRHLGYDGKAVESHSTGSTDKQTGQTSDPDADWGKHETIAVDSKTGKVWAKVKSWFGYGLHVIADTQYEIPVAVHVTSASASEQVELRAMIREIFEQTPALADRCQDFSADRGLDCGETKALLWDEYRIRPLIDTRELWREEKQQPHYDPTQPITRPLFPDRVDTIVHTEKGTTHCVCPVTGEMRDLAFQGFEANRNTLKYRCPAAAYGFDCLGRAQCHAAAQVQSGDYGRIVRIDITQQDRRIFVPTPHNSPSWKRGYNRRSALERINSRIGQSFGFENHTIRGKAKMQTRVSLALAVMMAMALGHVKAGRKHQMRSLVQPIPATG